MGFPVGVFLLTVLKDSSTPEDPFHVKTTHGWVYGSVTDTRKGRPVMEFLGIPYAKPPVGKLRFKGPVETNIWPEALAATEECPVCMHQRPGANNLQITGKEECLCLNIYTPKASSELKLPVIFYIHGAGYPITSMSKRLYGPDMLLDKDVVLVTANYRLGVLGFLTTNDPMIPGNFGLKDQAAALRWVKANALNFGGDPESITLMGSGEGAASVQLHMISPMSKDLFQRAVMHSGSALCLWGLSDAAATEKRSRGVAKHIGCPLTPTDDFLACLQRMMGLSIINSGQKYLETDPDPIAFWNPVIEHPGTKDPFLVDNPLNFDSNKPLLAGFNYGEGMQTVSSIYYNYGVNAKYKLADWNIDFYKTTANVLSYGRAPNNVDITNRVMDFYFGPGNKQLPLGHIPEMNRMFGDFRYTNCLLDAVEKHSGPKYLYHFNYNTTDSFCSEVYKAHHYGAACHWDELMYLFPMDKVLPFFYESDSRMSAKMVELWTNFAKNSVPSAKDVKWDPVRTSALEHLEITKAGAAMEKHPIGDRRAFWKSLGLTASNHKGGKV